MLLGMMIVGESWKRARAQPQRPLKLEEEGDGRRRWVCTLQGPPLNITHGCSQTPSLAATGLWSGCERGARGLGCGTGTCPTGGAQPGPCPPAAPRAGNAHEAPPGRASERVRVQGT